MSKTQTPNWLRPVENILEELNEGVAIVNDQMRVVFANKALIRLGQFDREESQGLIPDGIFSAGDLRFPNRQREFDLWYGRHRDEFCLPRRDGEKIPTIFRARLIQGPDGRAYYVITITDFDEKQRVERQLRETNALLERRQQEIDADLALAARVQQTLAPRSIVWNNLSVEAHHSPARTIGGDFGVVLPHGNDELSLLLCDVSGHGIGSALMANRIYSETLHQLERAPSPSSLLQHLHHFVHSLVATDGFYFTMAVGHFSESGHHLTFASAGHPPAIHVSKSGLSLIHSQSGILGCLAEATPSDAVQEIHLDHGDRLILYTDGLVEVFNSSGEMLGVEGLEQLVVHATDLTLPKMRQAIIDKVTMWSHGPLTDDVSLVIVEVR